MNARRSKGGRRVSESASSDQLGPTGTARQSDGSSKPASTDATGLQAEGASSTPHTRALTKAVSREVNGAVGHGNRTDALDSTRPEVSIRPARATSIS